MAHHTIRIAPGDTVTIVTSEVETDNKYGQKSKNIIKNYPEFKVAFEDFGLIPELFFSRHRKEIYVLCRIYIGSMLIYKYKVSDKEFSFLMGKDRSLKRHYINQHANFLNTRYDRYLEIIEKFKNNISKYEENKTQN